MKEKRLIPTCMPIVISLFLPVLILILYCFGYTVTLFSYTVFSVIIALFFLAYLWICKNQKFRKPLAFLPIFALINLAVYVFKSKSVIVLICMSIGFICSAIIAEKACSSSKAKIASVLTSVVLSVPVLVTSLAVAVFGNFNVNTVVDKIYSPNKTYYAEIVDSDQGALGGDTIVYVHKNSKLDLFVLTISKTPKRIYIGEWKEYETMSAEWNNENCLMIDSTEYNIEL